MTTNDELHALNVKAEAILGDDLTANTDERIIKAMQLSSTSNDMYWYAPWYTANGKPNGRKLALAVHYRFADRLRFWTERHGEPWQADLEQWVSAYRADPRPFASDVGLCFEKDGLWDKIRDFARKEHLGDNPKFMRLEQLRYDSWRVQIGTWWPFEGPAGTTPAEAITRAFVSVFEQEASIVPRS